MSAGVIYTSREEIAVYRFKPAATFFIPLAALLLQSYLPVAFHGRLYFFDVFDLPLLVTIFFGVARRNPAVGAVTGLAAGRLDLCCLPTLAVRPGARLIGRFRREYPAVVVDMSVSDDPADLVELLRSGHCELGITEAAMVPSELQHHVLMDQELVVVLPPDTAWQARPVSLSRLRDTPFVTTPPGTSTRRLLDEAFAAVGAQPEVVVVTAQREALLPLVLAGAGATLLPESIAHTAVGEGAVIARPRPAIQRTVVLAHRSGPLSPAAAAFVELSMPTP